MTMEKRNRKSVALPINLIKNRASSNKFNFEAEYQRALVWTSSQKTLLIDSIWQDFDIPKVYLHEKDGIFHVVDGKQRLTTIISYLNDEFVIKELDPKTELGKKVNKKKYSEIDPDFQSDFEMRVIDSCILGNYSEDDIKDMFLRLQQGTTLVAPEIRRNLLGNMPKVVTELSDTEFCTYCLNMTNKRYAYEDAIAKILHIWLRGNGGYIGVSPGLLKKTYDEYKRIDMNDNNVKEIKSVQKLICNSFKKSKMEKALKKWSAITLTHVLKDLSKYTIKKHKDKIAIIFRDLGVKRIDNEEKEESARDLNLSNLTNAARSDSPSNMQARHDIVLREFFEQIPELEPLDDIRDFSDAQRKVLFYKTAPGHICQGPGCKTKLEENDFHADHKKPHSKGGRSKISNGQALCPACNLKKSDRWPN